MKIYVRDDDVLLPSRVYADPLGQFVKVHELCEKYGAMHRPAILCGEIMKYPTAIEYIRHKIRDGSMEPQLHGWYHVDYAKMTELELRNDLTKCAGWMQDYFWRTPTIWYTPWGGNTPLLTSIAASLGMQLVDCSVARHFEIHKIKSREQYDTIPVGDLPRELFIHWWADLNLLETKLRLLNGHD